MMILVNLIFARKTHTAVMLSGIVFVPIWLKVTVLYVIDVLKFIGLKYFKVEMDMTLIAQKEFCYQDQITNIIVTSH